MGIFVSSHLHTLLGPRRVHTQSLSSTEFYTYEYGSMTMASRHRTAPSIFFNKRGHDDPCMFENPVAQAKCLKCGHCLEKHTLFSHVARRPGSYLAPWTHGVFMHGCCVIFMTDSLCHRLRIRRAWQIPPHLIRISITVIHSSRVL